MAVGFDYGLIVIGGGAAGLTAARSAVRIGIRVAMIEKDKVGGDCTWIGCVPSKALIAAARAAHEARHSTHLGIHTEDVRVDFAQVMRHVHETIHEIYAEETPDVLREEGIDVFESAARFTDSHTIALSDGRSLRAKKFIIATGSHPWVPEVFREAPYLTNESLFNLEALPEHLIILGGGPIGTEMGQAFRRLGAEVTIIDMADRLLPRDDSEAGTLITETLEQEGVTLKLGTQAVTASGTAGQITIGLADGSSVSGTHLLIALGRRPSVMSLDPQAAGITRDSDGRLMLNTALQTSQPHIYAAGDVTGGPQFTHYAGSQGFVAMRNAMLPLNSKITRENVPWATYCDPEVAHVGLTEDQARQQYGDSVEVTRLPMARSDRAMTEGRPQGFIKAVHLRSGKLLGVTIVGVNAADLLTEWIGILGAGGSVRSASGKTRVYPSFDSVNGVMGTAFLKKWIGRSLAGRALRTAVRLLN